MRELFKNIIVIAKQMAVNDLDEHAHALLVQIERLVDALPSMDLEKEPTSQESTTPVLNTTSVLQVKQSQLLPGEVLYTPHDTMDIKDE